MVLHGNHNLDDNHDVVHTDVDVYDLIKMLLQLKNPYVFNNLPDQVKLLSSPGLLVVVDM